MEKTVVNFLEYLQIPISKRYCEQLILSHPDYPSLLSVVDTIERLGIKHKVFRLEEKDLEKLAFPYLLPLSKNRGDMALITSQNDLEEIKEDMIYWDNIVLEAESTNIVMNNENNRSRNDEVFVKKALYVLFTSTILLVFFLLLYSFSWFNAAMLITSICGSAVGYILIAKELGIKYKLVESLCNAGKDNTNCDKVLDAEDVKILGFLKFSDIVITYFLFQFIIVNFSIVLSSHVSSWILGLSFLSLLTIPIIVFSLYYQYFKAKTWCRLCLMVDAILVIQVIVLIFTISSQSISINEINFIIIVASILLFTLVGSLIFLLKSRFKGIDKITESAIISKRVKHSQAVFEHLLFRQPKIESKLFEEELLIGKPDAPVKIIMASNLHCDPCKDQHALMLQLITSYPDKVCVAIRFMPSGKDFGRLSTANEYILQYWYENIYGKSQESEETDKLLHNWYTMMDLTKFKEVYVTKSKSTKNGKKLEMQQVNWTDDADIAYTPTFFINGYKLPKNYDMSDLLALIPDLADITFLNQKAEENIAFQNI